MSSITAAITGIHGYVPEYVLSNAELEKIVDTNDEWISTRTGIKERRILKEEGKGASHLAYEAIIPLLEKTNTKPEDIDMVLVATITPDFIFPSTSNIICDMIGAKNAWGYDLSAACSGFLFGLETARNFIETGRYKKILFVGTDKMSSIVDYEDRSTCILFGDGAAAVLLEPNYDGLGVQDAILKVDGSGLPYLNQKAGGSRNPASLKTVENKEHFLYQEGATVFKSAVSSMADVSAEIIEKNQLKAEDIAWLVPHQANKRIIDATAKRANIPEEKVMINIQKYGNTTAATIPLCLWDYEDQLKKGDNLIFASFGGGFTWGAMYLKWAYDYK